MPRWSGSLKLPPGFKMAARSAQVMPDRPIPVSHLAVQRMAWPPYPSCGNGDEDHHPGRAQWRRGNRGILASGLVFGVFDGDGGRKVTAVGEVPPATVRSIASLIFLPGDRPALVPKH